jgi:HD superfamily phosphohydrolase YqeK
MDVEKVVKLMIEYFGNDVKRINHALKVHGFAKNIARMEGLKGEVMLVLEVAAVLHDIGIKESERKYG